jgi:hypothetical protein
MRGDPLHNYKAVYLKEMLCTLPVLIFLEYLMRKNNITAFFDLLIKVGKFQLAVEIETTRRHLLDNARKAHALNIPVWFVVPTRKLQTQALKMLEPLNLMPGGQPIKVFLLAQAANELRNYVSLIIAANNSENNK